MSEFKALPPASQGANVPVLFVDAKASPSDLLDTADQRFSAVFDLLGALSDCRTGSHDPEALASLAVVARLLLADATCVQQAAIQQLQRQAKGVRHD